MSVSPLSVAGKRPLRARAWWVTALAAAFAISANAFGHAGRLDKNGCHFNYSGGTRHCHKPQSKSVCGGKTPAIGEENVLYGRVVTVIDGDTFKARIQGALMVFRMADIDAPEAGQPYGREARALLKAMLDGKDVVMRNIESDNHGRFVVHVWLGNRHINRELASNGAAWFYPQYAHDNCLYEVEIEARDARRGLWALPLPERVEPWVWRERNRAAADARRHKAPAPK
jgi:endonuclease YncB( thermonuclease family)